MKHSLLPIALSGVCISGFSAAAQNEISVGLADLKTTATTLLVLNSSGTCLMYR